MHDQPEHPEPRPEGETRDQLVTEYRTARGVAQDLAAQYGNGAAWTAGAATVTGMIYGAGKVVGALTSKDETPKSDTDK